MQQFSKAIYLSCGLLFVLFGAIGLLLPIVPTTPFLIVAAFCFSKSSERLHRWLLHTKGIGPLLRNWEEHGVIDLRSKCAASVMIVLLGSLPLLWLDTHVSLKLGLAALLLSVMGFIWTRPSESQPE